jgi:hypothetical protein
VLVSYFENQHGDYLVTVASYETGDITLYHSDFDFKPCRFTPKYFENRLGSRSELRQAMSQLDDPTEELLEWSNKELRAEAVAQLESSGAEITASSILKAVHHMIDTMIEQAEDDPEKRLQLPGPVTDYMMAREESGNLRGIVLDPAETHWLLSVWLAFWPGYQAELISIADAAGKYNVSTQYLYRLAGPKGSYRLRAIKYGNVTMLRRKQIDEFFARRRDEQDSPEATES